MDKPLKVVFAPGAFDTFEGSQEELDELQAQIMKMFESGEAMEQAQPVDLDELMAEDPEYAEHIMRNLSTNTPNRNLQ